MSVLNHPTFPGVTIDFTPVSLLQHYLGPGNHRDCPVHCKMLGCISGLYSLMAVATPSPCDQNISRHCVCPLS